MLINPIKIDTSKLIDQANDSDYRFKNNVLMDSRDRKKRVRREMRFASSELERVQDSINRNSNLSSDPTASHQGKTQEDILNLRPYEKEKIIDQNNPYFKYKANSTIERVFDKVFHSRNSSFQQQQVVSNRSLKMFKSQNHADSKQMSPKEIYSNLHNKTHFKAVYEMFVTPSIQKNDDILKKIVMYPPVHDKVNQTTKQKLETQYWIEEIIKRQEQKREGQNQSFSYQSRLERLDEKELAKELLIKCNFIRKSNMNLQTRLKCETSQAQYKQLKSRLQKDISSYKNIKIVRNPSKNYHPLTLDPSKKELDKYDYVGSIGDNLSGKHRKTYFHQE